MAHFIFLIFFLVAQVFAAQACLEISEQQLQEWTAMKPKTPGLTFLLKAKKIVDAEQAYALTLGNDKTAHCYLGCRIGEDVNFETAHFFAWKKEYSDATDCDANTHFDVADYEATIIGAQASFKPCDRYCKSISLTY